MREQTNLTNNVLIWVNDFVVSNFQWAVFKHIDFEKEIIYLKIYLRKGDCIRKWEWEQYEKINIFFQHNILGYNLLLEIIILTNSMSSVYREESVFNTPFLNMNLFQISGCLIGG